MHSRKNSFLLLLLVLMVNFSLLATENNIQKTDLIKSISNEILEPEIVESPLVSEAQENGRLYLSSYDPEHYLYPVRIIAIDGWLVPDEVLEEDLRLALGDHQLTVIPDFSNIEPKIVFMDSPWQEKKIIFTINKNQDIAVTARLINRQDLIWEVQLYRIAATGTETNKESSVIDNHQDNSLSVNLN